MLQKVAVFVLGWAALAAVSLSLWWLLVGQHRTNDDDEEFKEALRRKVRDDERAGRP